MIQDYIMERFVMIVIDCVFVVLLCYLLLMVMVKWSLSFSRWLQRAALVLINASLWLVLAIAIIAAYSAVGYYR